MEITKIFKNLVMFNFLINLVTILPAFVDLESEEVLIFNDLFIDDMSNTYLVLSLIFYFCYLTNLSFLYKFKKIGLNLYIYFVVIFIILSFLSPPSALDSWWYVVDGLTWLSTGSILVFLYFTPLNKKFI